MRRLANKLVELGADDELDGVFIDYCSRTRPLTESSVYVAHVLAQLSPTGRAERVCHKCRLAVPQKAFESIPDAYFEAQPCSHP